MSEPELIDALDWWRVLCEVVPRLNLCGDLPGDESFDDMLDQWVDAGITDIIDLRDEWSDEDRVAASAPDVAYHWLGTHDDGGPQDMSWFESGVGVIKDALGDPDVRLVVHCHMGINRAPSLVFAVLLDMGFGIEESLEMIRTARPIAAILYATDALRWFAVDREWTAERREAELRTVRAWFEHNEIDVVHVISRIRTADLA